MSKAERITRKNHDQLWGMKDARINAEAHKNDNSHKRNSTGVEAKDKEIVIRDMVLKEGITWSTDLRCRAANRDDIFTSTESGETLCIEVKHGGGSLAYASQYQLKYFTSRDRDLCLPGVDYVVYYVNAKDIDSTDRETIADEYMVATRDDFLDLLVEYCHGKRSGGWETAVKFGNAKQNCINIQSTYIQPFMEGLVQELGERTMSLREFCTSVLGREPRWK